MTSKRWFPSSRTSVRRHAGYGVQDAVYQSVGAALLKTLGQGLGADFTADTKAAWTDVYDVLSGTMIAA